MSWPYVAAVWQLRLEPTLKLLLLALADQADTRGTVSASRQTLERLTGLGRSTVKRTLRVLSGQKQPFVESLRAAGQGLSKEYRLHIPGVRGVQTGPGVKVDPGSTEVRGGVHSEPTPSPVLIPKSKSLKAGASAPTLLLLKKLVHEQLAERPYELNRPGELIELSKDLQSRCKRAGFEMENWDLLYQAIREVLGAKGVAGYARPRTHAR